MKIKIRTFGSVTDFLDKEFEAEAVDTDSLMFSLSKKHSELLGRKLLVAVNDVVIQQNTKFREGDVVAIMPPYSGG